jgi:hypothetical protein
MKCIKWISVKGAKPRKSEKLAKAYQNHSNTALVWFDNGHGNESTGIYFGYWHLVLKEWFVMGLNNFDQSKVTHFAYINGPE